jgi:REP element-mobilizing transposase RayT
MSQLTLDLKSSIRWGGRRIGAGRKAGPKPRVRHAPRAPFRSSAPLHVTLKVLPGIPSLRSARLVREVERSFARACEGESFRIVHDSIQADHVHLIAEANDCCALGRGMKSIAARLARAVHRAFTRRGRVLADRFHARALRTPREVRNALAYVLLNARRHLAKRIGPRALARRSTTLDPASSSRWFDGWTQAQIISSGGPQGPSLQSASVAPPRTWLLRSGWRRHGLVSPREVPDGGVDMSHW